MDSLLQWNQNLGQNPDFRAGFHVAVAEMRALAHYCLPLVHVGGLILAAKGHDPQEEITRAERAIHVVGASMLQTCLGCLDSGVGSLRTFLIYPVNPITAKGNLKHLL